MANQRKATFDPKKLAKGVDHRGTKGVVCRFDEDTFEEIRQRAIANKVSVAEQVRILVQWGLMA